MKTRLPLQQKVNEQVRKIQPMDCVEETIGGDLVVCCIWEPSVPLEIGGTGGMSRISVLYHLAVGELVVCMLDAL